MKTCERCAYGKIFKELIHCALYNRVYTKDSFCDKFKEKK